METDPPKNGIEDESEEESEEKSDKKSDIETKDKIEIKLDNETTFEFVPGMGSFNPDMLVEKIDISQYVSVYIKKRNPTHYEKFF